MPIEQGEDRLNCSLSKLSPGDVRFESHKATAQEIARLYGLEDGFAGFIAGKRIVSFERYSVKINACGSWLKFVQTPDEKLKLVDARFCKSPNCPMCQWRTSLKWRAKFLTLLPQIQEKYPSHRWLFLTLTIRNCELDDLKTTLKRLNEAFNRLSKLKRFPMDGLVKSVEVTRTWDCWNGDVFLGTHGTKWVVQWEIGNKRRLRLEPSTVVHPHLHVCGLVPAGYFAGKNYIRHDEWIEMWKQCLRVDYEPTVNIKAVKPKKPTNLLPKPEEFANDSSADDSGMVQAICETLKYTVKEKDLLGSSCKDDTTNSTWLKSITQQLYKARKVEYRGVLKDIGKEIEEALKNADLIKVSEEDDPLEKPNLPELEFQWIRAMEKYILVET
jgi:plasmid rolling circle replication initiator protein Rep